MCKVYALTGSVNMESCTSSLKPERGKRRSSESWHLLQLCPVTDLNFNQGTPHFKPGAKGVKQKAV